MAGGYAHQPQGMQAVGQRMRDLEQQLAALRRQITGIGIQVDPASNSIVLGGSRAVKVLDTDGHAVAYLGALPPEFNRSDGSAQPGMALYREDGSLAAMLGDANPLTPPYKQSFQVIDRANNVILADDTNGGKGIALPYLTMPAPTPNSAPADLTTSATFVTLQATGGYWMNPKLTGQILVYSSSSTTTGQVRVTVNGTQVGPTITVSGGMFQWVNWGPVAIPGNFTDAIVVNFDALRNAGTGNIGLRASAPIGVQT